MKATLLSYIVGGFVFGVDGLGINCRGSGMCTYNGIPGNTLQVITGKVANLASSQMYVQGQQIAAVNAGDGSCVAAFYQNIGDRQFSQAQTLWYLKSLENHGCSRCGSIPTDE